MASINPAVTRTANANTDLSIPKNNSKASTAVAPGGPISPAQPDPKAKAAMPTAAATQQAPKAGPAQPASSGPPQPASTVKPQTAAGQASKPAPQQPPSTKPQAASAQATAAPGKPVKQPSATTPTTGAQKAPAPSGTQAAGAAKKDTTAATAAKQPAKPPSTLTPEQQKKLDDLRKKVKDTRQERLEVQEFTSSGRHFAELKQTMDKTKATGGQDELNKELNLIKQREERLVSLKLEIRREEIIKELNNLKSIKKPDAAIQQEMKKLEADQKKILDQRAKENADLKSQLAKLVNQIEKDLPQEMSSVQREIDTVMNSKTAVSIRQEKLKEQLNAAKVQSSTLLINAKKLEGKLAPGAKTSLEPVDIESFDAELGKIENRQRETLKLLPVEEVPETPVAQQQPSATHEEAIEDPSVQRPLSPTQSPGFTPIAYQDEQLETPQPPYSEPPSAQKSPGQSMELLTSLLGTDLVQDVTTAASEAATRTMNDEKADFVAREQRKVQMLEEDKLTSMKKVVAYERSIRVYPERQKDLARKLTRQKAASELLTEVLEGLCKDEVRLREIHDQLEASAPEEQPPAEEDEAELGAEEYELLHGEEEGDAEEAPAEGEGEEALEDGAPLDQEYLEEEEEGTPPAVTETTFDLDADPVQAQIEE